MTLFDLDKTEKIVFTKNTYFNPFVPNAPFQGVEKGCIGKEWVKSFLQCAHIIFALKLCKRLWISNRDQNIEVFRRLEWVAKWVYSDSSEQNS